MLQPRHSIPLSLHAINAQSWRYPTVHRMPLSHIDPSMTLGFYVRNQSQLMQLCANLELVRSRLITEHRLTLIAISYTDDGVL